MKFLNTFIALTLLIGSTHPYKLAGTGSIHQRQGSMLAETKSLNQMRHERKVDVESIMKMVDSDGSGKVTKRELVEVFEKLAKLVNYELTLTDLGELGYLWAVMDIDNSGELNFNECEQILKNLALTTTIKEYGQRTMGSEEAAAHNKAEHPEKAKKETKAADAGKLAADVEGKATA